MARQLVQLNDKFNNELEILGSNLKRMEDRNNQSKSYLKSYSSPSSSNSSKEYQIISKLSFEEVSSFGNCFKDIMENDESTK